MNNADQSSTETGARRASGAAASRFAIFSFAIAAISALALLASGPGNRFGWWDYRFAFTLLRWAAWGGASGAVLSLYAVLWAGYHRSRRAVVFAVTGLVAGALAFGIPWQLRQRAQQVPPIHDITTDTVNPPRFVAAVPLRKGAANGVDYAGAEIAQQQKQAYTDIVPLALPVPAREAFERCLAAARGLGWEIVAAVPEEGRIEATDTTSFFGFRDDVVIRITAAATGSQVDVRSLSRVGRSDLGTNAKRVRAFLGKVKPG